MEVQPKIICFITCLTVLIVESMGAQILVSKTMLEDLLWSLPSCLQHAPEFLQFADSGTLKIKIDEVINGLPPSVRRMAFAESQGGTVSSRKQ